MDNKNIWTKIFDVGGNKIKNVIATSDLLRKYLKTGLLYQISCRNYLSEILTVLSTECNFVNNRKRIHDILNVDEYTDDIDNEFIDFMIYRNTPIIVTAFFEDKQRMSDMTLVFSVIKNKRHIESLHRFMKKLSNKARFHYKNNKRALITFNGNEMSSRNKNEIIQRSFSNVFIPTDTQEEITHIIRDFINRRDWYVSHKIPYHLGLLLYGKPGTGKTSVVQAIADMFDATIYSLSVDKLYMVGSYIRNTINYKPRTPDTYRILLIEDIDCCMFNRDNSVKNDNESDGFGTLLNLLDGVDSPSNIIYIFTTNHVEKLDPALIRPGRIDLKVEISEVCPETLDKFLMFHFNKHLPDKNIKLREGLLFAELQIMVMKRMTMAEILKTVTIDETTLEE